MSESKLRALILKGVETRNESILRQAKELSLALGLFPNFNIRAAIVAGEEIKKVQTQGWGYAESLSLLQSTSIFVPFPKDYIKDLFLKQLLFLMDQGGHVKKMIRAPKLVKSDKVDIVLEGMTMHITIQQKHFYVWKANSEYGRFSTLSMEDITDRKHFENTVLKDQYARDTKVFKKNGYIPKTMSKVFALRASQSPYKYKGSHYESKITLKLNFFSRTEDIITPPYEG